MNKATEIYFNLGRWKLNAGRSSDLLTLQLDLDLGVPGAAVTITVCAVASPSAAIDSNGWPIGFFEKIAGSMPDLERAPQGEFERRDPLE